MKTLRVTFDIKLDTFDEEEMKSAFGVSEYDIPDETVDPEELIPHDIEDNDTHEIAEVLAYNFAPDIWVSSDVFGGTDMYLKFVEDANVVDVKWVD